MTLSIATHTCHIERRYSHKSVYEGPNDEEHPLFFLT